MKCALEVLAGIALVQGALGLLNEFTHWRVGFVRDIGFLDGYEVYASVALLVLAFALYAASESRKFGGSETESTA